MAFAPHPQLRSARLPTVDEARRTNRWPVITLLGILTSFIALATFIALRTPAYESADEPDHVENIETLVSGHWYGMHASCIWHASAHPPSLGPGCSGTEAHQAPLYYLLLAGWQELLRVPPQAPANGAHATFGTQNGLFAYHSVSAWRFLLRLRALNIVIGALTVFVTFAAVRQIATDPWTPVVSAAFVAALPHFVFLSAFVTNDNLVNLLGALLTLVALRYVRAPSIGRVVMVGVVFGLLVATKLSALPLGLLLVTIVLWEKTWVARARDLAFGLGASFATCGWYLIQNTVRYGDPLATTRSESYLAQVGGLGIFPPGRPYSVSDPLHLIFVAVPRRIMDTFWYQSGWNQFVWSWPVGLVIWIGFAAAVLGLVHRHVDRRTLLTLGTVVAAALLSVWIVAFETATYQARYALVGVTAFAALAALGLERWRLSVRFLLPVAGLCGTLVAIQQNVLAVHWAP